ncbi:unnamed protein product [Plutella xylostella]|uniref:(diamondback moth) hypothetical protein n=1 Tax=Plutella xylostella TaxID=51655 RepID=A0A8S4CXM6_PLUXY|nr:unnamed protein product [Plutella xylostella]
MNCEACRTSVSIKELLKCYACRKAFHYRCLNITDAEYTSRIDELKNGWRCPPCSNITRRTYKERDSTPVRARLDTLLDETHMSCDESLTGASISFIDTQSDSAMVAGDDQVSASSKANVLRPEAMTREPSSFTLDTKMRDGILNGIRSDISKLVREVLSTELKLLQDKTCKDLNSRITGLERETLQQQQWARLQNIEIVGVPENKNECLPDVIKKLATHLNVELQADDVEFAHRVQPKRTAPARRPRTIVVRLRRRIVKDTLIAAARKSRKTLTSECIETGGEKQKIYVNEHLTLHSKQLLMKCKEKAKETSYDFVWTKNCRIYVRKNEKSPHLLISSEADIKKMAS